MSAGGPGIGGEGPTVPNIRSQKILGLAGGKDLLCLVGYGINQFSDFLDSSTSHLLKQNMKLSCMICEIFCVEDWEEE